MEKTLPLFTVPEEVLKATTKCLRDYQCLETGVCGGRKPCRDFRPIGGMALFLDSLPEDHVECGYRQVLGRNHLCLCPVYCEIHKQKKLKAANSSL
jgi:hypothetical protein